MPLVRFRPSIQSHHQLLHIYLLSQAPNRMVQLEELSQLQRQMALPKYFGLIGRTTFLPWTFYNTCKECAWATMLTDYWIIRVEVFFAFQPHARHIFHEPSFLASLSFPPSHIGFPHVGILHAICAVGSFYTVAVPPPLLPDFSETPAGKY